MYECYTKYMHEVLKCMRTWMLHIYANITTCTCVLLHPLLHICMNFTLHICTRCMIACAHEGCTYTYGNITTCTCILLHLLPQHIWILHHTHAWVRLNIIQYVWFVQYVSTLHYTYAGGHMRIATYNWMYRALIEYIWILHYTYAWVRISYNIYEYIIQYIWIYTHTIYMYITLHIRMSAYMHECVWILYNMYDSYSMYEHYTIYINECICTLPHTGEYIEHAYNMYESWFIQYVWISHYTYAWVHLHIATYTWALIQYVWTLHYIYAWICMPVVQYVWVIYGVASVSRIDRIIGLFCKRAL